MAMLTINLPGDVLSRLQAAAHAQRQSLEAYVVSRLVRESNPVVVNEDSLLQLVAEIKATPLSDGDLELSKTTDVSDLLARTKPDPHFDWDAWQREWDSIELETAAMERADAEADLARDGLPT
jgi:hypothetical protein